MRDRREVDLVEGDEFVGKEMERPAGDPFRRFAAGEFDQVCFGFAIEFQFVVTVRFLAVDRIESPFPVAFANVVRGADAAVDVLTDFRICEPVVSLQENLCSSNVSCFPFTSRNEPLQRLSLLLSELHDVFLLAHSTRDAPRDDKLVGIRLKLHSAGFVQAINAVGDSVHVAVFAKEINYHWFENEV